MCRRILNALGFGRQARAVEGSTVQDVLDRIDAKLEAIRSSVTRYAEPPWGGGWNGYGAQLEQQNILMDWICEPGACAGCRALEAGSPYEHLPAWPGSIYAPCGKKCRCRVEADPDSWDRAL